MPGKFTSPNNSLPGQYVRDTALKPREMSITDAAKLLGVTRPALSNFLNGKAAASADMAARIERAFGIPAQKILDLQAAHDAANSKSKAASATAKAYVPPFLAIKANEIEDWADANISARTRMAVFLRTLVNSTGVGLSKVDFPGNDDAERPGWDGLVMATEGTPWIPEGNSGWEFGTDKDPKSKANDDYTKRTKNTDKSVRDETTLVFVTPRIWRGRDQWVEARRRERKWKDVRAYDASNLEQWLEQSISAQAWFANETHRVTNNGVLTLDKCWSDWANASDRPLAASLFATAVRIGQGAVHSRLSEPPEEPTIIAADSTEEGLAFISQLFTGDLQSYRDRVVVFSEKGVLPKLVAGSSNFIAVPLNREVERELAPFSRSIHSIVIYPRNAANAEPHVTLEPLNYEAFRVSMEEMGFERDEIERRGRESGRSLTVLRRRLSKIPAVRTPEWAANEKTAARLVPFLLAGAWHAANENDKVIVSLLAGSADYDSLEQELQALTRLNDAPVWSVGTYRGVVSKIDLLFAIAGAVTELETYFNVARYVLSESDPSLDMPEEQQWAAGIYGKTREISETLRQSISETLVLLAVHGNTLFQARLGLNVQARAARLVKDLLTPLTTRALEEHERDLPTYAEAAPEMFLEILEDDLKSEKPASFGLLRPSNSGIFGRCLRSGLLWALEGLAWSPTTLPRAAYILAKLAEIKIDDNWSNKPIGSLEAIFRFWMPQTAAPLETRLTVMHRLAERVPDVAWQVCVDQFADNTVGDYSHKPRWRNDGHGFGQPVTNGEAWKFRAAMIEMALNWKQHGKNTLGDLIERVYALNDEQQAKLWKLVKLWSNSAASDLDKAWLREKIRVTVMSRRGAMLNEKTQAHKLVAAADAAYKALEPNDLLNQHEWLFRQTWVEESADELEDMDFDEREARIEKRRKDALAEIFALRGTDGILQLAEMGQASNVIGSLMARILPSENVAQFILAALPSPSTDTWTRKGLVSGILYSMRDDAVRTEMLRTVASALAQEDFARILTLAPFDGSTWALVDELGTQAQDVYWQAVSPHWARQSSDDLNGAVERLIATNRPRAAFDYVHFVLEEVKPALLFRLMKEIASNNSEPSGHFRLDPYHIAEAFKRLDASGQFSTEEMAGLEFPYIEALSRSYGVHGARGIPHLETFLEEHPEFFAEAVTWVYRRSDGREDPEDIKLDERQAKNRAEHGYSLLQAIRRIPGRNKIGEIETDRLLSWVNTVRQSCSQLGRQKSGDGSLGQLLSHAPTGKDGVWPCEPVRDVLEKIQSKEMARDMTVGRYNARGVHWRGEGGGQERELADQYRRWAEALELSHPFVSSEILRHMADTYEVEAKGNDIQAKVEQRLL